MSSIDPNHQSPPKSSVDLNDKSFILSLFSVKAPTGTTPSNRATVEPPARTSSDAESFRHAQASTISTVPKEGTEAENSTPSNRATVESPPRTSSDAESSRRAQALTVSAVKKEGTEAENYTLSNRATVDPPPQDIPTKAATSQQAPSLGIKAAQPTMTNRPLTLRTSSGAESSRRPQASTVSAVPKEEGDFLSKLLNDISSNAMKYTALPPTTISDKPPVPPPLQPPPVPLAQASSDSSSKRKRKLTKKQKMMEKKRRLQPAHINLDNIPEEHEDQDMDFDHLLELHEKTKKISYEEISAETSQDLPNETIAAPKKQKKEPTPRANVQKPESQVTPRKAESRYAKLSPVAPKKTEPSQRKETSVCKFWIAGICNAGENCKFRHEGEQRIRLVCRHFKTGSCSRGESCPFLHDLRAEPCRFYHIKGICDTGEQCPFSHEPLTRETRYRLHSMTGPCKYYHLKGYCTSGEECLFSHQPISEEERQKLAMTAPIAPAPNSNDRNLSNNNKDPL